MKGRRTCVILGAGASRSYRRSLHEMPLQSDIADKLFMQWSREGNISVGAVSMGSGLRYSQRLDAFLRAHFKLGDLRDDSLAHAWKELQARGHTLETLYSELEPLAVGDNLWVIDEFEGIVRTVITDGVERAPAGVCDYHRALIRQLEPGDFIVNFNWDSIASDALYFSSRLWSPVTGFGVEVGVLSNFPTDAVLRDSDLLLLHVHGSVCLYLLIDPKRAGEERIIYLAPDTYDPMSSMLELLRLPEYDTPSGGAMRDPSPEESSRFHAGWIYLPQGQWLKPLFVPPSSNKPHYRHPYNAALVRLLHSMLPRVQQFIIAGYSVPSADLHYLRSMFVPAVIDENANVLVINLANDDVVFRQRIDEMFPTLSAKDYRFRDFGAFCDKFMSDAERRGLTGFLKNKGQVAIVSKPTVVSEPDQRPSENEGLDSQS